jgi:hypothetical protein
MSSIEVVVRNCTDNARRHVGAALEAQGVPLRALHLVKQPGELRHPYPLRCDLRESWFDHAALVARYPPIPPSGLPTAICRHH